VLVTSDGEPVVAVGGVVVVVNVASAPVPVPVEFVATTRK
jgi:hypothetical protein